MDIGNILKVVLDARPGQILLVAAVLFLLLGVIGKWAGKFDIGKWGRIVSIATGVVLMTLAFYVPLSNAPKIVPGSEGTERIKLPRRSTGSSIEVLVGGKPATNVELADDGGYVTFMRPEGVEAGSVELRMNGRMKPVLGRLPKRSE